MDTEGHNIELKCAGDGAEGVVLQLEINKDSLKAPSGQREDGDGAAAPGPDTCAGRHVTFPADGCMVSGYLDPADPWAEAELCTSEELTNAYRRSCDRHGVRPIAHVLQQLQGISVDVCNDRYEMLSLRGIRLDARQVEALEEIFKRVKFRTLDLENTQLDDDSAISLLDMVEYYESCRKLNLAGNIRLTARAWQTCSRMLKKTNCLEILDLRGVTFSDQCLPILVRSLRVGSCLSVLRLEHSNMTGRNLLILGASLRTNDHLRELFLADNKMTSTDGVHLGNILKNTCGLSLLDVRNNNLQDVGVSHLCDGLFEQNDPERGLHTLVLWHNQLTHASMPAVASALATARHLHTLNLGQNPLGGDGVLALKEGLIKNRSLLRLGLQGTRLDCGGAVALAEFLAETKLLLRVDLRENDIRTAGLMALQLALSKSNKSLTRLDMDRELKADKVMKEFVETQLALLEDITRCLTRNKEAARLHEMETLEAEQRQLENEESVSSTFALSSSDRPDTLELDVCATVNNSLASQAYDEERNDVGQADLDDEDEDDEDCELGAVRQFDNLIVAEAQDQSLLFASENDLDSLASKICSPTDEHLRTSYLLTATANDDEIVTDRRLALQPSSSNLLEPKSQPSFLEDVYPVEDTPLSMNFKHVTHSSSPTPSLILTVNGEDISCSNVQVGSVE